MRASNCNGGDTENLHRKKYLPGFLEIIQKLKCLFTIFKAQ